VGRVELMWRQDSVHGFLVTIGWGKARPEIRTLFTLTGYSSIPLPSVRWVTWLRLELTRLNRHLIGWR
jgi:hypothetical protein